MDKKYYVFQHLHQYGATMFLIKSDRDITEDEVISKLDIDYEPWKDETVSLYRLADYEIIEM